jgi:hypothetical protein
MGAGDAASATEIACGVSGPGTVSEIALALENHRPVVLLDADDAAAEFFSRMARRPILRAKSPEEAVAMAKKLLG